MIIAILISFIGWFIYHTDHKTTTASGSNTATTEPSTTSTKTTTPSPQPANETAQAAATRAVTIITGLQNATEGTQTTQGVTPASYVDSNVSNGDFTASFKTAVDNGSTLNNSGQEGISCTNNFPGSFGAGTSTLNGASATVLLTFLSTGTDVTSSFSQVPQVTLQYANGNWSVSGYGCITNPSQS